MNEKMASPNSAWVKLNGKLAQFLRADARADSDEPNTAYWEENWKGVTERDLRHALRPTNRLGTHGRFFRRNLGSNARLLEAGCGTGFWMRRLEQNGHRVTGLDYAVRSLHRSKHIVPELELTAGDLFSLPYRDAVFDAYVSFGVVEHFIDGPTQILEEARRVLKPGGVVLVSTPFRNCHRQAVQATNRDRAEVEGLRFHQYYFTLRELQAYLREAGFEVLPDHQIYSVWHGVAETLPNVKRFLDRIPLMGRFALFADYLPILPKRTAHMIFAVARKPI